MPEPKVHDMNEATAANWRPGQKQLPNDPKEVCGVLINLIFQLANSEWHSLDFEGEYGDAGEAPQVNQVPLSAGCPRSEALKMALDYFPDLNVFGSRCGRPRARYYLCGDWDPRLM